MNLRGEYEFKNDTDRINYLVGLIEEGSQDPQIREFTLNLLNAKGVPSYDYLGEIKAIFEWVRDNITYRRHVLCRDSFTTAKRVMELRSGDCDNCVVLLNSMLTSVGVPTGMRLVSSSLDKPFHHIYSLAGIPPTKPSQWIPLDATEKSAKIGYEPPYKKRKDYYIICS
jgi:transglutaminase-like putative cysteine protease